MIIQCPNKKCKHNSNRDLNDLDKLNKITCSYCKEEYVIKLDITIETPSCLYSNFEDCEIENYECKQCGRIIEKPDLEE